MSKKIIIFDFDGVIVYSMDLSYGINKDIMPDLEFSEWKSWFCGNVYKSMRKEHQNDHSQDYFFERYEKGVTEIAPIDGMVDVLNNLSKNYTLIMVSASTEKSIERYLCKYGLDKCFIEILGKDTHRSKVEKFQMIAKKYRIEPHETLIVTDSVGDIKEAQEVGVKTLAVTWGVHEKELLKKSNPDFIAEKPEDIPEYINKALN